MAQLPDSSTIRVILEQIKSPAVTESGGEFWKEVIHIVPEVLWVLLAFVFLFLFYRPLCALIPKIDGFEFNGVKLSFLRESFDGVIKVAERNIKWNVHVPEKDKERSLKRAIENSKLLSGARLLWVDDEPEYCNNERRILQQLGVYCDFAQTTKKALFYIKEFDYDCIISDMVRKNDSEMAGIELIRILKESTVNIPVILYVGVIDETLPTPAGAFGITNRPDQFLHLLMDALERTRR